MNAMRRMWPWLAVIPAVADTTINPALRHAHAANCGWIKLGPDLLATATLSVPDSDDENIADPWEWHHFGGLDPAGKRTDWDHDGHSDAAEAIALTDPKDPSDFLSIVSQSLGDGLTTATLTFTTHERRRYRIEHDDDLAGPWTDSGLGTFAPDPGATTSREIEIPAGPARFFRVAVRLPLAP